MIVNERELATLTLLLGLSAIILLVPRFRTTVVPALGQLIKAALAPSIVIVCALFFLWCAAVVALAWQLDLWTPRMAIDTGLVVLTVGVPLVLRTTRAESASAIWSRIVTETVALTALVAFYVNLEPLPFWLELVVQPLAVLLVSMELLVSKDKASPKAQGCLRVAIAVGGLALLTWTTVRLVATSADRDWPALVFDLALTIWLPLSMFAFVYSVALWAAIESIIKRMRRIPKPPAKRRVVAGAVLGLHGRLRWATAFNWTHQQQVAREPSFCKAMVAMRRFRAEIRTREAREADRRARLEVMAGEPGVGGDGAQLDRREFDGTKRALRFIHIAQAMRFERLGGRYWDDLTDMVISPLERYGFVESHGITVEVGAGGRVWRAWRMLPNSWVLGIGGRDGSPGEFLYSSREPPRIWPGSTEWIDGTFALELPPDWERNDSPIA